MTFYNNLKIRDKLFLGYAVLVVSCCLVGYFGIKGMSEIKSRLDDMHDNLVNPITTIADIDHHTQQHHRLFLHYLLNKDIVKRKMLAAQLAKEERLIKETLEHLATFALLPHERKILKELSSSSQDYLVAAAKVVSRTDAGADFKTLEGDNEKLYLQFTDIELLLKQLSEFNVTESEEHFEKSSSAYYDLVFWMTTLLVFIVLFAIIIALLITRSITNPLNLVLEAVRSQQKDSKEKARQVEAIAGGDLSHEAIITQPLTLESQLVSNDETGVLLKAIVGMSEVQYLLDQAFAEMTSSMCHNREQEKLLNWFKNGQYELNNILRGDKSIAELTEQALEFLTEYLDAGVGVFYVFNENEGILQVAASYALNGYKQPNVQIHLGEGLAGQAALEKKMIVLNEAPPDYLRISSGLGDSRPSHVVALPLLHNNNLTGLLEIGSFAAFSDNDVMFLKQIMEALSIALGVNTSHQRVNELLKQTQSQAEELRVQQEELQQTNEELEERAQMLEQQREQIRAKHREVEGASHELQLRAAELERVSSYKSEFLANMSHELRTPLNSLMILSSLLKDNREGNLTDKQVEFAATINGAGRDLLNLINDILDLSKIESGRLEFHYEDLVLSEMCEQLTSIFNPVVGEKEISFSITREDSAPEIFAADVHRTQQILNNLLSNACKFTNNGSVSLRVYTPEAEENPLGNTAVAFAVADTGIGIPVEKQTLIFNAFQQADGSTTRTYGGTGLGLSISRQLARFMGGEISLASEAGTGSTFTLYLPVMGECSLMTLQPDSVTGITLHSDTPLATVSKDIDPLPAPIPDDRDIIKNGDKSILIIEDDLTFAAILADMVRGRGFSVMVAAEGESGIALAERYQPSAIILDVMLPHIDGWGVMRNLKDNQITRHIPVHFITCLEERRKAMSMGAIGFATKPVSSAHLDAVFGTLENVIKKTMKMLLIVEDDRDQATAMIALLENRDVTIKVADSGDRAIELLSSEQFDCIVLDLGLSDMGAFELLEELKKLDPERRIPVIIHTGRELTHEDERRLHHYAESIIIKGAKSPERLLNEVTLFLHLVETSFDSGKQRMIRSALDNETMLEGKKILIVDDDMRNIFSLSSALAEKNIIIFEAENGHEALNQLNGFPDIDLVLMDIMMPEMDGYEAMRAIRKDPRFHELPIIALTAKAMKGDREDCLKAGASDYIPKPVDIDKLFSLLRVWLYSAASPDSMELG